MKIAIIGGGVAAYEAARTARELSPEATITIYTREAVLPYRRPALSRMVSETLGEAQFLIKPAAFYMEQRIRVELARQLVAFDPAAKTLTFDRGEVESYDKLLLATGARCFLPPIPGMELDGVMSLRELSDLEAIRARLHGGNKKVIVIGGGLLGLELAQSLLLRGCETTVIEGCPTLLPRNLDQETAALVLNMLTKVASLTLRFGQCIDRIIDRNGAVAGVEINGETIPADLVLVSAGTRCNTAEAAAAGIPCNRGIVTDSFMQTGAPDVFAAGDCAEVNGASFGLFEAARMMGAAAARSMLDQHEPFVPQAYPARLSVLGLKIFSAGKLEGTRSEVQCDPSAGTCRKLFYDNAGQLTGAILVGDLRESVKLQSQIIVP